MRKKLHALSFVLAAALIAGIVLELLSASEPSYGGKPLSAWLEEYNKVLTKEYTAVIVMPSELSAREATKRKDVAALKAIGVKAIPTLLRLAEAQDTPLKQKIWMLVLKVKIFPVHFHPASEYHAMAVAGFSVLGADGKNAVPSLIKLLSSQDVNTRLSAADCLGNIGPDAGAAVPALMKLIGDTNQFAQTDILINLDRIHMEPDLAVPVLVSKLNPTNANLGMTIKALGSYGEKARPAVPTLLQIMKSTRNGYVRWQAETALKQISPETVAQSDGSK